MNPSASTRPFSPFHLAAAWVAALAMAGCEDRVAGTSVGTGNPTEIQLGFRDGTGSVALSGRVSVYAATQIPVEGYRPQPLLDYAVQGNTAVLKASDFASLADTAWDKKSIDQGVYAFNVVVTGSDKGSVLTGFGFDKALGSFVLRPQDEDAAWNKAHTGVILSDSLRALVDMQGTVDTNTISPVKDYHLFLYGTGFSSKLDSGNFVFYAVPEGKYDAFLISFPQKDHQASGGDTTDVFSTSAPLSPDATSLSRGELYDRVRLPDSLIKL